MQKFITIILTGVFASSCAPRCETACGLHSETLQCEDLQTQETKALESFAASVAHWSFSWTCDRITGFSAETEPDATGSGIESNPSIVGYTDCVSKRIVTVDEAWRTNAFTHELGHAIEACLGPPTVPVWHYGWEGRLINAAVNNATLSLQPP